MSRSRPTIPKRKPIFIGCEGESEQGYAGLLQDFIHDAGLHVHLNIEVLRAGDPLARIELAIRKLEHARRKRVDFTDRFVFLDTDQLALSADRAHRARALAADNDIQVIWQDPCFEAVLLRHFAGRGGHRPLTNQATETALRREWPEYEKPMSRAELARKIDLDAVLRAAGVEDSLTALLGCIGLIPSDV